MAGPTEPLAGIRVLDLTRLLPGPWATWVLSAMGAEVVKLEAPGAGDYARFAGSPIGNVSALFHVLNRGKRSIGLDLKREGASDLVLRFLPSFDVVIEQFRPGVMDRLGLGWPALQEANPEIILCSLTGYGQDGPMAAAAGHDLNYQALTGSLWLGGHRGGDPPVPAIPFADIYGAQSVVSTVLGALLGRERGGGGGRFDVSIAEAMGAAAAPLVAGWSGDGETAPGRGEDLLNGGLAQYSVYRTACGGHLAVGALEPKFFGRFADAVGRDDWKQHPPLPGPHQEGLRREIAEVLETRTRDEWVAVLEGIDCCVSPVLDPEESTRSAHFVARGIVGTGAGAGSPSRWLETSLGPPEQGIPPQLGEHGDEILLGLGLSQSEVDAFRTSGVLV